jgi:O-methyltransferase involved in polyketide biosynthesis
MEVQTSSFDRISPTALMVAYVRQFTDIPYSKELSELVDAKAVVEPLQEQQSDRPVEIAVLIEGRYKVINQLMTKFKATQIIELASGLLPRGMEMTKDPGVTFVESDLPAMISCKQKLVKQLVDKRSNLHFIAIDATSHPSQFPLHADYLNPQKPITILCEGLLMYLTVAEKQQVFTNVRELLQIYGGVWITPDFFTKEDWERRWKISPAWQRFAQKVNRMTGTSGKENTFDNFAQVQQFVGEQGFWIKQYSMLDVLDQLTCLQALKINPDVAKFLLADSSVFVLGVSDS